MDEFIKSLDVSKEVLKASDTVADTLPTAAPGHASTANLLVRGVDAGPSETPTLTLDHLMSWDLRKQTSNFHRYKFLFLRLLLAQFGATFRPLRHPLRPTSITSRMSTANIAGNVQRKNSCRSPIAIYATIPRLTTTVDAAR